ncbi:exosortase/archaeosortase family protein [Streptacidiphilus pinicola]
MVSAPSVFGTPGRRSRVARGFRAPVSLVLLAAGLALALENSWFRVLEAGTAAPLVGFSTSSTVSVRPGTETIFLGLYTPRVFGLTVTPECTAALPIAALLALAGVLTLTGRFPLARILFGLLAATSGIFAVNQFRITMIGWAAHTWGAAGYGWAHATVGSLVVLAGVSAAIVAFLAICGGGAFRSTRRALNPSTPAPPADPPDGAPKGR